MRPNRLILAALAALAAAGAAAATEEPWVADARAVSAAMPPRLAAVLADAIAAGGPEGAIEVCRDQAPQMAKAASARSGWTIRRVSLRNRNPQAVPDAWERSVLAEFDRRAEAGEDPATLERAELVPDAAGRPERRYLRALPTQRACTACHGAPDQLSPEVSSALRRLYPDDRATGYAPGQIRGAIALRQPAR